MVSLILMKLPRLTRVEAEALRGHRLAQVAGGGAGLEPRPAEARPWMMVLRLWWWRASVLTSSALSLPFFRWALSIASSSLALGTSWWLGWGRSTGMGPPCRVVGEGGTGLVAGWEWGWGRWGGGAALTSASPSPPQAGPMVADQRGSELRLHHPSSKGPQAHGHRLLTPSPLYLSPSQAMPALFVLKVSSFGPCLLEFLARGRGRGGVAGTVVWKRPGEGSLRLLVLLQEHEVGAISWLLVPECLL